jgi:hypothetical protein
MRQLGRDFQRDVVAIDGARCANSDAVQVRTASEMVVDQL